MTCKNRNGLWFCRTTVIVLVVAITPSIARAQCCIGLRPPPLSQELKDAPVIFVGSLSNPRTSNGVDGSGTTDFNIEATMKSHPIAQGLRTVTIPHYMDSKDRFLAFGEIVKFRFEIYRAEIVGPDLLRYIEGLRMTPNRPLSERLVYCFPFLNSADPVVADDADREFTAADFRDYRQAARKFDANALVDWLNDPKTPAHRLGVFALLVGACGKAEHGDLIRRLIDNRDRHKGSGLDRMLVGRTLLQPKEGWKRIVAEFNRNNKGEFNTRYSALRAVRFIHDQCPDVIAKKDLVQAMVAATEVPDIADFAIEDLRRWRSWETTDHVLALAGRQGYEHRIIQRAILRFALQSPAKSAEGYVTELRGRDADLVEETEEILNLDPR